jgi:hypothetical protein
VEAEVGVGESKTEKLWGWTAFACVIVFGAETETMPREYNNMYIYGIMAFD